MCIYLSIYLSFCHPSIYCRTKSPRQGLHSSLLLPQVRGQPRLCVQGGGQPRIAWHIFLLLAYIYFFWRHNCTRAILIFGSIPVTKIHNSDRSPSHSIPPYLLHEILTKSNDYWKMCLSYSFPLQCHRSSFVIISLIYGHCQLASPWTLLNAPLFIYLFICHIWVPLPLEQRGEAEEHQHTSHPNYSRLG